MPFYLRKSLNVGPFRFNLSGSGVGVSTGVKGFRIGTGPRGHYIHTGRDGFYYRSSLGGHRPARGPGSRLPAAHMPGVGPQQPVETGNILQMVDADAASILNSINEKISKIGTWPIALTVTAIAFVILLGQGEMFYPYALVLALLGGGLTYWLYRRAETRLTTVLMYDLDDIAVQVFEKFTEDFDELSSCRKAMNIDTQGVIYDWKRHGGAAYEVKSGPAHFGYGTPKRIKTNVSVPYIAGGLNTVYFFPDLVLICQKKRVGGLDYRNVSIQFHHQRFQEAEQVPSDALVVGSTWRFVRRDGGPDRRFNNNRQIPIVNYQAMVISGPGNFQKVLYLSKNIVRDRFLAATHALGKLHGDRMPSALPAPQGLISGRPHRL